ncbi:hypothetical protein P5W99_24605 [Paraburkholderia sp. A3BS-1L]
MLADLMLVTYWFSVASFFQKAWEMAAPVWAAGADRAGGEA